MVRHKNYRGGGLTDLLKYRQEVSKFEKKDGIIALCVWLGYIICMMGIVALRDMLNLPWFLFFPYTIITTSLLAGIVFVIVLRKKQGLASIGLHKENIWPAIRLGLLLCLIPIVFIAIIPGIFGGFNQQQIGARIIMLVSIFFFAAHEDVIFVGFIQTRLYGFFKTDIAAISVGALLFAAMHIPPWLMMGQIDLDNLLTGLGLPVLSWILMHLVFVSVFKKHFSLVPVFILHTMNNYSLSIVQTTTVFGVDFSIIFLALYALAACVLFWHTHRKSKKGKRFDRF